MPTEPFIVITARKYSTANRNATYAWVEEHYPELCQGIAMMEHGGSTKDVIDYKSSVVNHYQLTDYTDNSRSWLNQMMDLTSARLWHWRKGMDQPIVVRGEA